MKTKWIWLFCLLLLRGRAVPKAQVHLPLPSFVQRVALLLPGNLVHSTDCRTAISPTDGLPSLCEPPTLASCELNFHKPSGTLALRPLKCYELYFHTASGIPSSAHLVLIKVS